MYACVHYLQIQVVQVPQQNEVLSTDLTNHIVLEEDGLDEDRMRREEGRLLVSLGECVKQL